ncbi:MAG: hypothetical protein ACREBQ_11260, partial [Nitrososphaerales archaeon]
DPTKILVILNKLDLTAREELKQKEATIGDQLFMEVSAKTGEGLRKLKLKIVERVYPSEQIEDVPVEPVIEPAEIPRTQREQ